MSTDDAVAHLGGENGLENIVSIIAQSRWIEGANGIPYAVTATLGISPASSDGETPATLEYDLYFEDLNEPGKFVFYKHKVTAGEVSVRRFRAEGTSIPVKHIIEQALGRNPNSLLQLEPAITDYAENNF